MVVRYHVAASLRFISGKMSARHISFLVSFSIALNITYLRAASCSMIKWWRLFNSNVASHVYVACWAVYTVFVVCFAGDGPVMLNQCYMLPSVDDEMFSDIYKVKEVYNGLFLEVEGKVSKGINQHSSLVWCPSTCATKLKLQTNLGWLNKINHTWLIKVFDYRVCTRLRIGS